MYWVMCLVDGNGLCTSDTLWELALKRTVAK